MKVTIQSLTVSLVQDETRLPDWLGLFIGALTVTLVHDEAGLPDWLGLFSGALMVSLVQEEERLPDWLGLLSRALMVSLVQCSSTKQRFNVITIIIYVYNCWTDACKHFSCNSAFYVGC